VLRVSQGLKIHLIQLLIIFNEYRRTYKTQYFLGNKKTGGGKGDDRSFLLLNKVLVELVLDLGSPGLRNES